MKSLRRHSLFALLLLFWVFSSFPRIWYFCDSKNAAIGIWPLLRTLIFGFLQDGALAAVLLLPFQYFYRSVNRFPLGVLSCLYWTSLGISTFFLLLMMANVEFFRYFGSNVNLSHLAFITDTDIMMPSLKDIFSITRLIVTIGMPLAFVGLALWIQSLSLDYFMRSRRAMMLAGLMLISGVGVRYWGGEQNPLRLNLSENYVVSFFKFALMGDELRAKSATSIEQIMDTNPLPNPKINSPHWRFFDPDFPLAKATEHQLCQMGRLSDPICSQDNDGDGSHLRLDCNDQDLTIHPGAKDFPGNSIDEDCSGMDANPPNIIFIHWEGARSVNVGSIGYGKACTPRFDALAKKGLLFTNAYANGTQTRWSLTSVYSSILPRLSSKWIFKHNPDLNLLGFPQILRNHGYHTIYIHGGDINYGNLKDRFYDYFETMIDRTTPSLKTMRKVGWGLIDQDTYGVAFDFLKNRKDLRPFYMTIATLSVHHPFNSPNKRLEILDQAKSSNRYMNTLHYADFALGEFIKKVQRDPQLKDTLIVISADHGMNWHTPHRTTVQNTLWEDLVWVPILLVGKGWNVPRGVNAEVRQLADIGPTVLDRVGIEVPNHFVGQSLLRRFGPDREPKAFFGNANGGLSAGVRVGPWKYFISFRTNRQNLYNVTTDRQEKTNLANDPQYKPLVTRLNKMVTDVYIQNTRLIQKNRFWSFGFDKNKQR